MATVTKSNKALPRGDGSAWHQDTWHEQGPLSLVRGTLGWVTQRMTWSEALSPRTVPEQRRREAVPLGLGRTQVLLGGAGGGGGTRKEP